MTDVCGAPKGLSESSKTDDIKSTLLSYADTIYMEYKTTNVFKVLKM